MPQEPSQLVGARVPGSIAIADAGLTVDHPYLNEPMVIPWNRNFVEPGVDPNVCGVMDHMFRVEGLSTRSIRRGAFTKADRRSGVGVDALGLKAAAPDDLVSDLVARGVASRRLDDALGEVVGVARGDALVGRERQLRGQRIRSRLATAAISVVLALDTAVRVTPRVESETTETGTLVHGMGIGLIVAGVLALLTWWFTPPVADCRPARDRPDPAARWRTVGSVVGGAALIAISLVVSAALEFPHAVSVGLIAGCPAGIFAGFTWRRSQPG